MGGGVIHGGGASLLTCTAMPYFICPRCTWRGSRTSRTAGFTDRPVGCSRCGFGFLFELIDDYFPSPLAGVFVCDQQGRILAFGRGADVISGYDEVDLMGASLDEVLHLAVDGEPEAHPVTTALEWGVRVQGKRMFMETAAGKTIPVTGDLFPAYDDDGGLLAVFTPRQP